MAMATALRWTLYLSGVTFILILTWALLICWAAWTTQIPHGADLRLG